MKSTNSLRKNIGRKTKPDVVKTLIAARKQKAWRNAAHKIAGSTRKHASVNLDYIHKHTKEGDTIVVLGKVLGTGILQKKIRVCALAFSAAALQKMKESKSEAVSILDEIRKNPKAEGVKFAQ